MAKQSRMEAHQPRSGSTRHVLLKLNRRPSGDLSSTRIVCPAKQSFFISIHQVLINTSDIPNADYDGDACIELYGSGGKTSLFEVSGPFKRGAVRFLDHSFMKGFYCFEIADHQASWPILLPTPTQRCAGQGV